MAPREGDLRDVWCDTARRATDTQLVVCAAVAIVAIIAFVISLLIDVQRALFWWPLALPPLFIGAFGLWGITNREIESRDAADDAARMSHGVLYALRWCAAVAAGLVGILAAVAILRITIGKWVS